MHDVGCGPWDASSSWLIKLLCFFRSSMTRISFPPGEQQGRDMCWLAAVGKVGGRYVGTVGE
jgi:hypothetical protein